MYQQVSHAILHSTPFQVTLRSAVRGLNGLAVSAKRTAELFDEESTSGTVLQRMSGSIAQLRDTVLLRSRKVRQSDDIIVLCNYPK